MGKKQPMIYSSHSPFSRAVIFRLRYTYAETGILFKQLFAKYSRTRAPL